MTRASSLASRHPPQDPRGTWSGGSIDSIDLVVFHQANPFMLEHLGSQLNIPEEKFYLSLARCGNTVSCSSPIALKEAQIAGVLRPGQLVMVVGFGVGYSWAAALLRWLPFCAR
ncbi:MAG: 3-oxoacyl-[acyl-carrier-protein] synthase III C-terminal domain-containing protein [Isosphaeraceae bacterium]